MFPGPNLMGSSNGNIDMKSQYLPLENENDHEVNLSYFNRENIFTNSFQKDKDNNEVDFTHQLKYIQEMA